MGRGDMLKAKSVRKTRYSSFPFRWRHQAAKERRFCILWINRMVNKQVEKRIAELRLEFLLMKRDLREEMSAALYEPLRQQVEEDTAERSVYHIKLDQKNTMTSSWLIEMGEVYKDNTKEDEGDEENSTSRNMLDASSDDDTSDVSNDDSSQSAKCEQEDSLLISSDFPGTSQLMKESAGHEEMEEEEEERSKSHAKLSFVMGDTRCLEEVSIQVDRTKEEEDLLIEKQWKEWLDKQEMKVNPKQVELSDQQSPEKQGEVALPVSEKQMSQTEKTRKQWRIKTYFSDLFNSRTSYKWERFENED